MGFLTRDVFENANSFEEAKDSLSKNSLIAPVYFILGGTRAGEVCMYLESCNCYLNVKNSHAKCWMVWKVYVEMD